MSASNKMTYSESAHRHESIVIKKSTFEVVGENVSPAQNLYSKLIIKIFINNENFIIRMEYITKYSN